jgi:hypothetical protein
VTAPPESVPELGPELGGLIELVRESGDPEIGLDAIRLELVRRLFERAQAARDFLLAGDRDGARAALDPPVWLDVWRTAAAAVGDRVPAVIEARLRNAALRTRFPPRRLRALLPPPDDARVLRARLDAAGIPLEETLARPVQGGAWWDEIRRRAGALEEAWERLENVVRTELAAAAEREARIASWRPSPALPLAIGAIAAALLVWLGLALGGLVPRPGFLDPFNDWFWSLPWP